MTTFCRVVEEAKYTAREKREKRLDKPQPWIVLKLTVGITICIMAYAGYVYIGRQCVPIILRNEGHTYASRGVGIALLAVFVILYLWMIWAYFVVVITPPGFAREFVQKSPQPALPPAALFPEYTASTASATNSAPPTADNFDLEKGSQHHQPRHSTSSLKSNNNTIPLGGPSYEELSSHLRGMISNPNRPKPSLPQHTAAETLGDVETRLPKAAGDAALSHPRHETEPPQPQPPRPTSLSVYAPPPIPYLRPEQRYCSRDGFVKPYRAHHCRACGTCVLKFDHHCPWIGQCVGARNHKFFVNFCQATSVFTAYTFGTLVAYTTRTDEIDGQKIAIIALSALFLLFTFTLFVSHARLIAHSQTTVENLSARNIKERIKYQGGGASGFFGSAKRVKAFVKEWGDPDTEGNLWWTGSGRKGWEETMGDNKLGWIFPIGRPLDDGLSYRPNWRFDEEGKWRRRTEWPKVPPQE